MCDTWRSRPQLLDLRGWQMVWRQSVPHALPKNIPLSLPALVQPCFKTCPTATWCVCRLVFVCLLLVCLVLVCLLLICFAFCLPAFCLPALCLPAFCLVLVCTLAVPHQALCWSQKSPVRGGASGSLHRRHRPQPQRPTSSFPFSSGRPDSTLHRPRPHRPLHRRREGDQDAVCAHRGHDT